METFKVMNSGRRPAPVMADAAEGILAEVTTMGIEDFAAFAADGPSGATSDSQLDAIWDSDCLRRSIAPGSWETWLPVRSASNRRSLSKIWLMLVHFHCYGPV